MLTILNVAYPLAPVSRDAVGGAEQIVATLDAELVRRGHRSLVIACEGSKVEGTLVAVPAETGALDEAARSRAHERHRQAIRIAKARNDVDVTHLHGIDFHEYLPDRGPTLVTLHLPLDWYPPGTLKPGRPDMWLHPVSSSQAERAPQRAILQRPIQNGVDVDALHRPHARRDFALVLSRICPEKGIHLALEAARLADMPMLVGGQAYGYQAHVDYLHGAVQPLLDARRRFLGPLGFARKRRFLNAASCLAIPSLAAETSSLVAMEALACGTPVVAFPHGALPDIIEHGRTGFIVNDVAEMAQAMLAARSLDPQECRRAARSRFSLDVMIERYLGAYLSLAAMRTGEAAQ